MRLTELITISPVYPFEARFNVFNVGWVRRVVGIRPVRLLEAALMFARFGRVSNRSAMEVKAFPDISLGISTSNTTKSDDLQSE